MLDNQNLFSQFRRRYTIYLITGIGFAIVMSFVFPLVRRAVDEAEIRQQVEANVRQQHSDLECTRIDWSPDGTQFVLTSGCWTRNLSVYSIDGTEYEIGSFYYGFAFWSPNGKYLVAKTCEGSHMEPAIEYTVYDASSWNELCVVGSGDSMIGCSFNRECRLPLADDHEWLLTGSSQSVNIDVSICDNAGNCVRQ